jgi:hypothetical protein
VRWACNAPVATRKVFHANNAGMRT